MMKLGKIALDYIDSVCRKIRSSAKKDALREELIDHFEQKVSELMEKGFAQDCAEWEAVARMGDAQTVSRRLNSVYFPSALTVAKYICLAITCYLGFLNAFPYLNMLALLAFNADGPTSVLIGSDGFATMGAEYSSVGVIGGADGPTAIYVTQPSSWFVSLLLFIAFACLTVFLFLLPHLGKKRR